MKTSKGFLFKKLGFLIKKPGFLIKKPGFLIKKPGFLIKKEGFAWFFALETSFLNKNRLLFKKPWFLN